MRILHLLNWKLRDIIPELTKIKEQGFDAIQINPIQPLKEDGFDHWWLSYQPCGFSIGNQYGSRDDLINLCFNAYEVGIEVYADVIVTHVAGSNDGSLNVNGKVDESLSSHSEYFREKRNINDWNNRYEIINYCAGLPSFDLHNKELQNKIITFLNSLIDCGVDGFRFDSAKSIPAVSEGCDFFTNMLNGLKKDVYCYGEVIFASEDLIDKYKDYIDVLTNMWSESKNNVVTFVESHDSFYEFKYTCDKSDREITERYNRLTKEFPKTLYYARSYSNEWKSNEVRNANLENKNQYVLKRN